MNKSLLLFSVLALSFNSCSSQTEKAKAPQESVDVMISEVIDQTTWESKILETENPQIIDVRTAQEFSEGHLDNALNIDYYASDFQDMVSTLDKEQPVYVYCRSGGRSAKAAEIMKNSGFKVIYDLKGGYMAWK
jgi:rhodanese-related sulfurtransferase